LFRSGGSGGAGAVLAISIFTVPSLIAQSGVIMDNAWSGALLGTFTPIAPLRALLEGDPFTASVAFWDVRIPAILLAPVGQLSAALGALAIMARKLKNPLATPVTKPAAYATLAVSGFLTAGLAYTEWVAGVGADSLVAQLLLLHVFIGMILIWATTPSREGLISWIWRFRDRCGPVRDALLGDRSATTAAAAVFCLIVVGSVFLWFVVPTRLAKTAGASPPNVEFVVRTSLFTALLVFCLGVTFQWFVALADKAGKITFVLLLLLAAVVPLIIGAVLEEHGYDSLVPSYLSLSPIAHYMGWIAADRPRTMVEFQNLPRLFVTAGMLILIIMSMGLLRRWMRSQTRIVDDKLLAMGVKFQNPMPARTSATSPSRAEA
jgi:hypothetical protein